MGVLVGETTITGVGYADDTANLEESDLGMEHTSGIREGISSDREQIQAGEPESNYIRNQRKDEGKVEDGGYRD